MDTVADEAIARRTSGAVQTGGSKSGERMGRTQNFAPSARGSGQYGVLRLCVS